MIPSMQKYPFPLNTVDQQAESLFIGVLPGELALEIIRRVGEEDGTDLIKNRLVCKKLCLAIDNLDLWKKIFSRGFPTQSVSTLVDFKGVSEMIRIQSNIANRVYRLTTFQCGNSDSPICARLVSGKHLITVDSRNTTRIFSLESGRNLSMIGGVGSKITALVLEDDILSFFCLDQTLTSIEINTFRTLKNLPMSAEACETLIVSDRRVISGFLDGRIEVRDAKNGDLSYTLPGKGSAVCSLAASHGKLVSTAMVEIGIAEIKIWDLESQECLSEWTTSGIHPRLEVMTFDGDRLFTSFSKSGEVVGWDIKTGCSLGVFVQHSNSVTAFAILGSRLISYSEDQFLKISDVAEKKCLKTIPWDTGHIRSMHAIGEKLLLEDFKGSVELWDFQAGEDAILKEALENLEESLKNASPISNMRHYSGRSPRSSIVEILHRFSRMPKRIRDKVLSDKQIGLIDPISSAEILVEGLRSYLKL